jgi:hypothetical protein
MENRAVNIIEIIRHPSHYSGELVELAIQSMPALLRSMQAGRQNGAASFMQDWSAPCSFTQTGGMLQRCYITLTLDE